jgi:hypothetical protein
MTFPANSLKRQKASISLSLISSLVDALDRYLRERQGVFEYSRSTDCLFRLQFIVAEDDLSLLYATKLQKGDRIADLHFWNEQIPVMVEGRPTIAFARLIDRRLDASLAELARFFSERPDLSDIQVIRGHMSLGSRARSDQIARLAARFGFERVHRRTPLGLREALHRFGENILVSLLVLARNSSALRADTLWRDRTLTYLSRRVLEQRYPCGAG